MRRSPGGEQPRNYPRVTAFGYVRYGLCVVVGILLVFVLLSEAGEQTATFSGVPGSRIEVRHVNPSSSVIIAEPDKSDAAGGRVLVWLAIAMGLAAGGIVLFALKRRPAAQDSDEGWVAEAGTTVGDKRNWVELRAPQSRIIGFIVITVLTYVVIRYLLLVQVR